MGDLPLKRDSRFRQGKYKLRNPDKYMGNDFPIYRSGIELKFFKFCDLNENVKKWGSENVKIPYFDTIKKKNRLYYIDNYVEILEGKEIKKYIIEIKDIKATKKPVAKRGKKKATLLHEQLTWTNNNDKWRQAQRYAKKYGAEFLLLGYSKKEGFQSVKLDFLLN